MNLDTDDIVVATAKAQKFAADTGAACWMYWDHHTYMVSSAYRSDAQKIDPPLKFCINAVQKPPLDTAIGRNNESNHFMTSSNFV